MSRDIFDDFEAAAHFSRRAADAESLCRALMAAGLAAVEQARREEREACARIADGFDVPGLASRIRARSA